MKKIILAFCLMLLGISHSAAQTYEYVWAKRGGGIDFLTNEGAQGFNSETVRDIVVDSQDNYYFLCNMGSNSTDFDGNFVLSVADRGGKDAVLVSTDCNGNFRWSKTFGSHSGAKSEYLAIDSNDNIYVAVRLEVKATSNDVDTRIENDLINSSTLTRSDIGPHARMLFLTSYESNGTLRWIQQPQPQQSDYFIQGNDIYGGLTIDSTGIIHNLVRFKEGTYLNGNLVVPPNNGTTNGQWYIVKYDNLGNYLSHQLIGLDGGFFWDRTLMEYDEVNNQYYIAVSEYTPNTINVSYNNIPANRQALLLAIDATGTELWRETPLASRPFQIGSLHITETGNLQVSCRGGDNLAQQEFAGFMFPFMMGPGGSYLLVQTLDPNGNMVWGENSSNGVATFLIPTKDFNGITAVASAHANVMSFAGLNYQGVQNGLSDPVHFTLDTATGNGLSINSIEGNYGFTDGTTAVAFDSHGNMILGGFMSEALFLNHTTLPFIARSGGLTDLWVAKLAKTDCNGVPLSINDAIPAKTLGLAQNPVQDHITITGLEQENASYKLYSVTGRLLVEGSLDKYAPSIETRTIAAGSYFLQVYLNSHHETIPFIKE